MPEINNITALPKGVTDLAHDAAYVAVGLGVLGFQKAQVQRVELTNKLTKGASIDQRLGAVRTEVTKGVKQIDSLVESAAQFIETSFKPLGAQLPDAVSQLTTKAFGQAREVRSQIRDRVLSA